MVIAPGSAIKGRSRRILWVIQDGNGALFVFAAELGNQREVPRSIERPLNLEDEVVNKSCRGVASVIITVGLNDQREFTWGRSCVAGVEFECIPTHQRGVWEPRGWKESFGLERGNDIGGRAHK